MTSLSSSKNVPKTLDKVNLSTVRILDVSVFNCPINLTGSRFQHCAKIVTQGEIEERRRQVMQNIARVRKETEERKLRLAETYQRPMPLRFRNRGKRSADQLDFESQVQLL